MATLYTSSQNAPHLTCINSSPNPLISLLFYGIFICEGHVITKMSVKTPIHHPYLYPINEGPDRQKNTNVHLCMQPSGIQ